MNKTDYWCQVNLWVRQICEEDHDEGRLGGTVDLQ